jgi:hypothetical protein
VLRVGIGTGCVLSSELDALGLIPHAKRYF